MAKKRQKSVESQAEYTNSGAPGLYRAKNRYRYNPLWTNGRSRGVRFFLDFRMYLFLAPNRPGIPVFGRCPNINIKRALYFRP